MAGRTPAQAVQAFLEPLGLTIACVTREILSVSGGYAPAAAPHALTLARGGLARLDADPPLALRVTQHYRLVEDTGTRGPWKVQTAGYLYSLETPSAVEVLAFHWHPEGRGEVTAPHMHIGAAAEVGFPRLQGAHVPCGRVALEQVVLLAIAELGVAPLRDDWQDVLEAGQLAHETWRTWP